MTNKKYRVGIVGLRGIGSKRPDEPPKPFKDIIGATHAASLSRFSNIEVVGYCDLVSELLEEFKESWKDQWPNAKGYTNYKEMLVKEQLDILAITTSDHRHTDIAVDAANAGVKGIFCEKPLATSVEDADRMINACEDKGVVLTVDHTRRFRPLLHKIRNTIRSGSIGPLSTIVVTHAGPRAMLFRNGTHIIDGICFFADSEPSQVFARLEDGFEDWDHYKGDGGSLPENDPAASGFVLFRNGVRAFYCGSKKTAGGVTLQLLGQNGRIDFDYNGLTAELSAPGSASVSSANDPGSVIKQTLVPDYYKVEGIEAGYRELIDLIEKGGSSVSPAREARKTVQIMLGFLKSQQAGSILVDVPE